MSTAETADDLINEAFARAAARYDRTGRIVLMPDYPHDAALEEQIRYTLCEKFKMEIVADAHTANPNSGLKDYLDDVSLRRRAYDAHAGRIIAEFRCYYPGGDAQKSARETARIADVAERDARAALSQ